MRVVKFLLAKEFKQIFRNKFILAIILVMPVILLLILPLAANYEIRNINISVVDHDHSSYSQNLISKITASKYFKLQSNNSSFEDALAYIEDNRSDLILEIPEGFKKNLVRENEQTLFVAINAVNGSKANIGGAYLLSIIQDYNETIRFQWLQPPKYNHSPVIEIASSNWFNPLLNYHFFMVPGILAFMVAMIGGSLTAMNIVKEKEVGTIEQINVTPIKKHYFILGKLIPFWIIGNVVFGIGLVIGWLVYGIVSVGSLFVLFGFVWLFLLAILGFGLLISNYSNTQQQANLIVFFFMLIFILMGGLFTPINSMPDWAKVIANLNPVSYLIEVMRMVMLKGSGWGDVLPQLIKVLVFAIVLNTWAILSYRKIS